MKIPISTVSGGGTKSKLWMKILSNILNMELLVPETEEGPSLGSVYLAKVAAGDLVNLNDEVTLNIKEVIKPNEELAQLYEERYSKYKKIYPAIKGLFQEIK